MPKATWVAPTPDVDCPIEVIKQLKREARAIGRRGSF
jgi:hypothetical protein